MKYVLLAMALSVSTAAFAEEYKQCSPEELQILQKAEGEGKDQVDELIYLETPNFSCEVKTQYFFFPADCNRFTYNQLTFKIQVAGKKLTAKVNDGRISCTRITKTVLSDVKVTE